MTTTTDTTTAPEASQERLVDTTLGDLVTADPSRTRILEDFGLDYCCGGKQTLADAAAEQGVDPGAVVAALQNAPRNDAVPDWAAMNVPQLTRHILDVHHTYIWSEMPRLTELVVKVARVHGANHPELAEVKRLFSALRNEVEPHQRREEMDVFPILADFDPHMDAAAAQELVATLDGLIREHDDAGDLLAQLRQATGGYAVPADGCASYQAMLTGLEAMERDLQLHVHKENNVLFPRVVNKLGG